MSKGADVTHASESSLLTTNGAASLPVIRGTTITSTTVEQAVRNHL
jgi:hypothetical protein